MRRRGFIVNARGALVRNTAVAGVGAATAPPTNGLTARAGVEELTSLLLLVGFPFVVGYKLAGGGLLGVLGGASFVPIFWIGFYMVGVGITGKT